MVELKISDLLLLQNTYWTQLEETSHCVPLDAEVAKKFLNGIY